MAPSTHVFTHAVVFTRDGVKRVYNCHTKFDAIVLADALGRLYGADSVETLDWAAEDDALQDWLDSAPTLKAEPRPLSDFQF